ncbi:MAG: molybdopterin converting factor subunit 1 [Gammaproteobacteria bacterium]|nr:molybdopterin converting factor subunit 1 [Gammaproteobacteria bacterium]
MTVRVLFFASLREAVHEDALDLSLPSGATVADLRAVLGERLSGEGARAIADGDVRVAVNQRLLHSAQTRLAAGDEVAFLPPVTGG